MRVQIDEQVAYLLAVLAEHEIPIPKAMLHDLQEGQLGSMDSAAALGVVTAALVEKVPAERVVFPDVFDMLFEATRDAFAELESEWRAQWEAESAERAARAMTPGQLAKLQRAAKRGRGHGRGRRAA